MIGKAAAGIAAATIGMLLSCAGAVGIFLTGGAGTDPATDVDWLRHHPHRQDRLDGRREQRRRQP